MSQGHLHEFTPLLVKTSVICSYTYFLIDTEHIPFKDHFLIDRRYWCEAMSSQGLRDNGFLVLRREDMRWPQEHCSKYLDIECPKSMQFPEPGAGAVVGLEWGHLT